MLTYGLLCGSLAQIDNTGALLQAFQNTHSHIIAVLINGRLFGVHEDCLKNM